MRLIDADAVTNDIQCLIDKPDATERDRAILQLVQSFAIDEAPTIPQWTKINRWSKIKSERNLPQEGCRVLIYEPTIMGYFIDIATYSQDKAWKSCSEGRQHIDPTHWMPLPEPPRED